MPYIRYTAFKSRAPWAAHRVTESPRGRTRGVELTEPDGIELISPNLITDHRTSDLELISLGRTGLTEPDGVGLLPEAAHMART